MYMACRESSHLLGVQEDIAVMQQINGRMILSCGAVVSPLGWSGSQKLGMDLKGIHSPVPHFNDGPALKFVTKIFEKGLNANVPLSRANWFIMDNAEHSLVSLSSKSTRNKRKEKKDYAFRRQCFEKPSIENQLQLTCDL